MSTILPCPFCGEEPVVPDVDDVIGTSCDIGCKCGMAVLSVQLFDIMSLEEYLNADFDGHMYPLEYRQRALDYCVKRWNTRA